MTAPKRPSAPSGLRPAGRRLWRQVVADFDGSPHELALLALACRQADDVAALEDLIASDGLVVEGSAGQPRLNAAVTEVRQGRLALAKLLDQLALPADDDRAGRSPASRKAQKAARARWRGHGVADLEERRRGDAS